MKAVYRHDLPYITMNNEENEEAEIVCCKDCKYYDANEESCEYIGGIVAENNYCSNSEPKDET